MIKLLIVSLFLFVNSVSADVNDGNWELRISGKDNLEFGSEFLAGGLTVNWTTSIIFKIVDGHFFSGTGIANLDKSAVPYSRPEGIFTCNKISGTYVSKNGQIFETPHLRYVSFPVTGQVQLKQKESPHMIKLKHGMDYPGNYYGMLFECNTENDLGKIWLERSPRVSKEKASRQSIEINKIDKMYSAKIKQVKSVSPGAEIMIPLIDQWQMSFSDSFDESHVKYQLIKK